MANRFLTVLRQSGGRILVTGGMLLVLLALVGYFANSVNFEETFKALPFSADPQAPWYRGEVGFVLLGALAICVSCPRQVVSFFAAYFFGLKAGIVVALAAAVISCIVVYFLARVFEQPVRKFVRGKVDLAVRFWKENAFFATMLWRFMPAGSNLLTNMTAGAIGIPAFGFVAGSAVGYIPQTVIFAVLGSGIRVESGIQLTVSAILFILSVLLGLALYVRFRSRLHQAEGQG